MPSRFEPSEEPSNPQKSGEGEGIDSTKRYDVYCHRHGHPQLMVYRNVVFKRATPLFSCGDAYSRIGEYVELQQGNGHTVFVSRMSIIAFCEHGTELGAQSVVFE